MKCCTSNLSATFIKPFVLGKCNVLDETHLSAQFVDELFIKTVEHVGQASDNILRAIHARLLQGLNEGRLC